MKAPMLAFAALAATAVFSGAAAGQDPDPDQQLVEAYITCAMTRGDSEMAAAYLGLYGWTHEAAEDGMTIALPGVGGASFVLMADDGSFCHVESLVLGTDKAAEILALALATPGAGLSLAGPEPGADGCARYALGDGLTATLTGGGNDPVCSAPDTSAVRFEFAEPE